VGNAPEQEVSESDVDHGFGTVDAFFVIWREAAPARQPSERPFDDPSPRQDLKAVSRFGSPYDLDGEIAEGGLVHEPSTVK